MPVSEVIPEEHGVLGAFSLELHVPSVLVTVPRAACFRLCEGLSHCGWFRADLSPCVVQ